MEAAIARIVKSPEERRAEIIGSARKLFLTRGYEATSMQDVMKDLSIAKGTIYHYFRSKEELLYAVVEDVVSATTLRMEVIADTVQGAALDKLCAVILGGEIASEDRELLDHLDSLENASMGARLLAVAIEKQGPLYAGLLEQGTKEGTFSVEHPLETAEFMLAAFQFLSDRSIYCWTDQTLHRRAKAFPVLLERLTRARPGTFGFLSPAG